MATNYGRTWWGEQWLGALKNIDYSNRLPRGASYARNGMVIGIQFINNQINAKVQGSRRSPYKVNIVLPQFSEKQIDKLIDIISSQPVVLSKLLNRQLDTELDSMAEKAGMHLFPKQWSDLEMRCSCPDWAVPCKHLAAVIYKISMEIDNNPFLVFSLHGVDLLNELKKRGLAEVDEKVMDVQPVEDFLGDSSYSLKINEEKVVLDYTQLSDLTLPLSNLLPSEPAFYHYGDFKTMYQKELLYVTKAANKVLQEKMSIADKVADPIDKRKEVTAIDAQDINILQQVLNINPEFLADYQDSVVALRQLLVTCLHLLANGCVVPQIFKTEETVKGHGRRKEYTTVNYNILWQPAMIDDHTASIVNQLGQDYRLVAMLMSLLVSQLSRRGESEMFKRLFFHAGAFPFNDIGETNIPGGIRSWLDRYFIQSKYKTTFIINEADDDFSVDVLIDETPLKDVMASANKSIQIDMLKQLSILCDFIKGLGSYINDKGMHPMMYGVNEFTPFLFQVIPAMRLLGVKVILPKSLHKLIKPQITVHLKTKGKDSLSTISMAQLFSFDWRMAVGDEAITVEEFVRLLGNANGLMRFKEQYVYMDEATMKKLGKVLSSPPRIKPGELLQAALCEEYHGAKVTMTDGVREMVRRFTETSAIPLPEGVHAVLRPYQERGFSWMYRNMQMGLGSIIADDMGLGKTLQVITLLLKIKEEGLLAKEKALVIVPTGLLYNWREEIHRFTPSLTTAIYHGSSRDLKSDELMAADIILTTYGVTRSDVDKLKKLQFAVLVIDEAQNIKNSDTAQSKAIHGIPAHSFIAMSGTPVENRLSEFWSIIDFTNKGYLGTLKDFTEQYARPIQKEGDQNTAARFRKVTSPFMLRRLKTDKSIISDLPDKVERNEWALLTTDQAALYQKTLEKCMEVIEGIEDCDSQSLFKRQGLILQMILALKQICNHPTQYLKDNNLDPTLSGKTVMLLDLLRSIVDSGEKVLIFTQFKEMGEMIQHFISETMGEDSMFYHGGCNIKQRQTMVERFQNNRADKIFILSLKAAGTGLNLTAATHVIHYDLWWNPAVEAQATDRAYRIGQHRNVQVHRFITKNTFEERIDAMIQEKRHLADITVSSGENWIGKLSNKELHEIFG